MNPNDKPSEQSESSDLSEITENASRKIRHLLNLTIGKASDNEIKLAMKRSVELQGTNLWVLMFAILIASIGLNINSTAAVIGAMLISPIMGPIMGVGYGIGVLDFRLARAALKNLGIAVFISLCVSTLYFTLSPLTQAQPEILARSTPTIWDVLIAFFGGLAGIIAATRKEHSNIVPGVAIATALMPPLCAAGFGLANNQWVIFGGAFYLFVINCVFIAIASATLVRAFRIEKKSFDNRHAMQKAYGYILLLGVLTVIPSVYLAYNLVKDEFFKSSATQFIQQEFNSEHSYVTQSNIDPKAQTIEVTLIGEYLSTTQLADIKKRLPQSSLEGATLKIHQQSDTQRIDVGSLKTDVLSDLYAQNQQSLLDKEQQVAQLQKVIDTQNNKTVDMRDIPAELHALYPQITDVWLSQGEAWQAGDGSQNTPIDILNIRTKKRLSRTEQTKIKEWLRTRLHSDSVKVVIETN
ncbi:MAG: TIGR00341 family protein [Formosimonas sp.]